MFSQYQQQKVLILGGLGFIGSNLAQRLVAVGAKVTLVDNFLPDHGANWFNLDGIREQVQVHLSDLRQAEALRELIRDQAVIFNIAAQTSHSDSMRDPFLDLDINAKGNLTLLEACRAVNPEARIVFAGTRAFYGAPPTLPVNEASPVLPRDIYSINRFAAEQYHFIYHLHYGLPVTSLRIGNIYGPRAQMQHPKYNVLNFFVRLALEDQSIKIYGDGMQIRDYLHVQDACEAMLLAGLHPAAVGQIFNIGAGFGSAFIELARTIIRLAGSGRIEQVEWPAGSRNYDVGDFVMEIGKIQNDLDWQPRRSLEEGLQDTLEFYRKNYHYYW
ncbi:NAD-dependent epimerase [bacterium (Candidatus Blackallbacteria) CG17_big_fil_post_rev_8_21_14_2_50_48_46]|uniref:NAD-dependent epimerase n=1 Tax=bacterium (Candidatus Blackallbacteria) CG17_big_fil_post_rev_8_21_14_2_50_48_46 TaxID=2014261 RepID=A0A2M7FXZ4_9BACT|nr:MAG: NAD-dependent epimerase [bacterium (Candidatus Blackallbacteria) CG18_big_fil_WC_8_21_14_2_50_49_26]PIW13979.1 MAG: NAD-dependent epimerase [bacterium (Candidatus Blackallbacteria) CG17_big_fil_post_rev_8_21_14_2_50_48_46]PIW46830.1 MAG: NAD-dependent epimerase [bacterium (Candidatus Blackallbacteria) CG13_big_fil_rev_8_21_14_2_50_49_14]